MYPTLVLPIYRAPSTTDWLRILFVCPIHPIMHEVVMTTNRITKRFSDEQLKLVIDNPKRHYFAMQAMNSAFVLEHIFVMYRRCMLGAMRDPSAIMFAIVLTALEEAVLRSTMVYRYVILTQKTLQ